MSRIILPQEPGDDPRIQGEITNEDYDPFKAEGNFNEEGDFDSTDEDWYEDDLEDFDL